MYKEVLRSIAHIEIFPLVGLGIFMIFFMAWVMYVMLLKKDKVREYESIPLHDGADAVAP